MKHLILSAIAAGLLLMTPACQNNGQKQSPSQAEKIHQQVLTIDTHTDTPLNLGDPSFDFGQMHDPDTSYSRVDLPRMEQGHMDASFFAVFIGQRERTQEGHKKAKKRAMKLFKNIEAAIGKYPGKAELATNPSAAYQLEKENKKAIYIGVENGYALGGELASVETFYNMGARYITLCHTSNNDL